MNYSKTIEDWIPHVKRAINDLKTVDSDVEKISPAFVCAFLDKESTGDPNAYIPGYDSKRVKYKKVLTKGGQVKNVPIKLSPLIDKKTGKRIEYGYGVKTIMGAFQGSANWRNASAYFVLKDKLFTKYEDYVEHIANNRYNQARDFIASQLNSKRQHYFRPDLMAILHSRGSKGVSDFVGSFTPEQKAQIKSGASVTGDVTSSAQFAYDWIQPSRQTNKIMYTYARDIQAYYEKWAQHPDIAENDPSSSFIFNWRDYWKVIKKGPPSGSSDTISGVISSKIRDMPDYIPFTAGRFITPEELRKGIVAQVYDISDWHLAQLATPEKPKTTPLNNSFGFLDDQAARVAAARNGGQFSVGEDQTINQSTKAVRADLDFDQRRRYIQSLVEAEFRRRRFAARGTPPVHGPFAPRIVPGFPGLVMSPVRPIIGYIDSVHHTIDVSSAEGSTSVNFSSPRYWNEGEVWHWLGGNDASGAARMFPQWHNRNCVATNNYDMESGSKSFSELDAFYTYLIGVEGIEYQSNHANIDVTEDLVKQIVVDRKVKGTGFEINPETLEIIEYNNAIASLDEDGKFRYGTLANRIYGHVEPSVDNRPVLSVSDQLKYGERYGVTERQLNEKFLGNKFAIYTHKGKDRVMIYGPTYRNEDTKKPNQIQLQIMDWMHELDSRSVGGGV